MKTSISVFSMFVFLTLLACTERNSVSIEPDEALLCFSLTSVADQEITLVGNFTVRSQQAQNDLPIGGCGGDDFRTVRLVGNGNSNVTGAVQVIFAHCIESAPNVDEPSVYNTVNGWFEMKDGSGNRILASYQGEHVVAVRDTIRGDFMLTEGSGQFAGVQGNGCFRAINTGISGEFAAELRGKM